VVESPLEGAPLEGAPLDEAPLEAGADPDACEGVDGWLVAPSPLLAVSV
jgi:hypothetical protein